MSGALGFRARGFGWRHAGRRAWALRDVDLVVSPGERVLLLGASGSGKSTLLAALAGLLGDAELAAGAEAAGSLLVDGASPRERRRRIGLLLQDPDTQLVMGRVGDDVGFGPENHGVPADQIWPLVASALDLVGFPYGVERATAALSGGERQRLALAGVVALRPGLLLLDEPTANLDPASARELVSAVSDVVARTGATLVVIEHRVESWLEVIDRVVVLDGAAGVIADGGPQAVFTAASTTLTAAGVRPPGTMERRAPARTPGPAVVTAAGLSYRYPGASCDALSPTDVGLRAAQTTVIEGRSGSGKSTLAMLLAGLARPSAGAVHAAGDPRPLHRWRSRSLAGLVGTVFQNPEHQFVTASVLDELLVGPRRLGVPTPDATTRARELLERLRLDHLAQANPFTLSGGQKRRLSVATALVAAPSLLVLDEPTFGQDANTWRELVALLAEVRDDGTAVLAVSHDVEFADAVADRRLLMSDGRLRRIDHECSADAEQRAVLS